MIPIYLMQGITEKIKGRKGRNSAFHPCRNTADSDTEILNSHLRLNILCLSASISSPPAVAASVPSLVRSLPGTVVAALPTSSSSYTFLARPAAKADGSAQPSPASVKTSSSTPISQSISAGDTPDAAPVSSPPLMKDAIHLNLDLKVVAEDLIAGTPKPIADLYMTTEQVVRIIKEILTVDKVLQDKIAGMSTYLSLSESLNRIFPSAVVFHHFSSPLSFPSAQLLMSAFLPSPLSSMTMLISNAAGQTRLYCAQRVDWLFDQALSNAYGY